MKSVFAKTRIKKGDSVVVIAGRELGKKGKVLRVDHGKPAVYIEGVNMIKKAVRQKSQNDRGGIIEIEGPIHISNVMALDGKGKPTRVRYELREGKKVRVAVTTGEEL